jgi:hypothetical protein
MTNEQLTAYLQDESYIYTLSYEELKTLVVQYPYASNLRVLLLKKSYIEQNKDYDRNLQMASTYSTNRKHLYKLIKNLKQLERVPQNVILGEDYLELASLSDIGKLKGERDWVELKEDTPVGAGFSSDMSFNFEPEVNSDLGNAISDINVEEEPILDLSKQSEVFDNQLITKEEFIESEKFIENTEGVVVSNEPILDLVDDVKKNGNLIDTPIVLDPEWDSLVGEIVHDYTHTTTETHFEKEVLVQQEESINEEVIDLSNIDNLISMTENQSWNKSFFDNNNRILNFEEPNVETRHALSPASDNFSSNIIEELEKSEPIFDNLEEPVLSIFSKEIKEEYSAVETPIETPQIIEEEPVETVIPVSVAPIIVEEKEVEKVIEIETKPAVELEIVNEQKAKIIEATTPKTDAPKVSFTDWLRQFKAASSVVEAKNQTNSITTKPDEKPIENDIKKTADIITRGESQTNDFVAQQAENIDNQSVTNEENMRVISNDRLAEMFETPQNAPENLFGLQEKEAAKPVEIATEKPSVDIKQLMNAKNSDIISDFVSDAKNSILETEELPILRQNTEGPPSQNIVENHASTHDDNYTLNVSFDAESEDDEDEDDALEKEKKKKKKKKKMHDLAARSLEQDDEIVSEMLANILALQGHKKQAKAMYEKLYLLFPEKSDYFAAKIEKLRT